MRILVTGSRNYSDRQRMFDALNDTRILNGEPEPFIVVHGGASGADTLSGEWVKFMNSRGVPVVEEVHPAEWAKHGKSAGPIRNQKMVDLGADLCLAFPVGESRGTRHCMSRAVAAGIPLRVVTE